MAHVTIRLGTREPLEPAILKRPRPVAALRLP